MATLTTPPVGAPELEHSPTGLNEPSMEDILASIRRIIAEDQSNNLGRPATGVLGRRAAAGPVGEPILAPSVERAMEAPAPEILAVHDEIETGQDDGLRGSYQAEVSSHDEPSETSRSAGDIPAAAPMPDSFVQAELAAAAPERAHNDEAPLISHATGASITSSFHVLAESVLLQDPGMIERVARDTLRPMLSAWLEDNLPSIVERLVRAEIERVARGGRGRD